MQKLCLDIGGMSTKVALIKKEVILETALISYPNFITRTELLSKIKDLIKKFFTNNTIDSINISTCGIVDSETGIITGMSAVKDYNGTNFKQELKEFNVPILIENDANCALLGEMHFNSELNKFTNFASIVLGTGIGGAIAINRQLYKGSKLGAGEFGMILDFQKEETIYNYSQLASSQAIAKYYEQITHNKISTKALFELYDVDPVAKKIINEVIQKQANLILSINFILDLDAFIVGGAISENPFFIKKLNQKVDDLLKRINYQRTFEIISATLGNNANLFGAYYLN